MALTQPYDEYIASLTSSTTGVSMSPGLNTAGSAVVKVKPPHYKPEDFGAVGNGIADDLTALNSCIAAARTAGVSVYGLGFYFTSGPLLIERPDDELEYWDGTTEQRPISIYLEKVKTSSANAAVQFYGSYVRDRLEIGHLIGPGTGAVGAVGGTAERIGVVCEGPVDLKVGSISDFNFNTLIQNCYSSRIEIGHSFACLKAFYARLHPTDNLGNQENHIVIGATGGVFTSPALPTDALRRSRSADLGIHLENINSSFLDLGASQYCQLNSDSRAIQMDEDCQNNEIRIYIEGARDDGDLIFCEGYGNRIYLGGQGSPSDIENGKIYIHGAGNQVFGLNSRTAASFRTALAPDGGSAIVDIGHGNFVDGKYVSKTLPAASTLRHQLVQDGNSFSLSGDGSVSTITTGLPAFLDVLAGYEITCNSNTTVWYTSSNISVSGEVRDLLKTIVGIKGVTNHAKVALYILNGADNTLIGEGVSTGLESTSDWQALQSIERIPSGLSNIKIRIAVRNPLASETGCVIRIARPLATFNIEAQLRRGNEVLPHTDLVSGRLITEVVDVYRGFKYKPQITTDITATNLETNSRSTVILTGAASGTNVNAIGNLVEDQPCMIINKSGSSITFTTSAGAWTSSIVLADQESMTVLKTTGGGTFTSDVWRVG